MRSWGVFAIYYFVKKGGKKEEGKLCFLCGCLQISQESD